MARPSPYDEKTKAAIIQAALGARSEGKKWSEAYEAAKEQGYKGGLQYLVKLIRTAGGGGGSKRRGRKPGRKPGGRKPAAAGAGLGSIESIVERMVAARLQKSVARAIAALEHATHELKSL